MRRAGRKLETTLCFAVGDTADPATVKAAGVSCNVDYRVAIKTHRTMCELLASTKLGDSRRSILLLNEGMAIRGLLFAYGTDPAGQRVLDHLRTVVRQNPGEHDFPLDLAIADLVRRIEMKRQVDA